MSQSPFAPTTGQESRDDFYPVRDEKEVERHLQLLDDSCCRTILEEMGDETLTASEIAERCEFPLSTVYRKLESLTAVGYLTEGVRLRDVGRNPSEYSRGVDDVVVSISEPGGITVWISQP